MLWHEKKQETISHSCCLSRSEEAERQRHCKGHDEGASSEKGSFQGI